MDTHEILTRDILLLIATLVAAVVPDEITQDTTDCINNMMERHAALAERAGV